VNIILLPCENERIKTPEAVRELIKQELEELY